MGVSCCGCHVTGEVCDVEIMAGILLLRLLLLILLIM